MVEYEAGWRPIRVRLIDTLDIDEEWPRVTGLIEKSVAEVGGQITGHYLWSECRAGRAFLVVAHHEIMGIVMASVWRFEDWQTGRKLRCLTLGAETGTSEGWIAAHQSLAEKLAHAGNAGSIVAEGREGFRRVYPEATVLRVLYELEIDSDDRKRRQAGRPEHGIPGDGRALGGSPADNEESVG